MLIEQTQELCLLQPVFICIKYFIMFEYVNLINS